MRQLKLDIEALEIETFATGQGAHRFGTVKGHQEDAAAEVPVPPSWPEGTCVETCTTAFTGTPTCKWTCNDDTCGDCPTGANDPRCGGGGITIEA